MTSSQSINIFNNHPLFFKFKYDSAYLALDDKISLSINALCNCTVFLSLRHVIHIGVKPILYEIATVMAASLVNTNIFGNYKVDRLIVIGNVFNIKDTSPIYREYTALLQVAVDEIIRQKEKDTNCFILHENLSRFLQITRDDKQHMLWSLTTGILQQVSSSTYCAIASLSDSKNNPHKVLYKNKQGSTIRMDAFEYKAAVLALQKGQSIKSMDFFKNYQLMCNDEEDMDQRYTLRLGKLKSLIVYDITD